MNINSLKDNFNYRPVNIEFAGLYGDTISMRKAGWDLSLLVERLHHIDGILIYIAGINKSLGLRIQSQAIKLDGGFFRHTSNPLIAIDGLKTRIEYCSRNIVFKIPVGHKAEVISLWSGVIGAPSLVDYKDVSFDDYYHFPSINETVFIPENKIWTIEEHLEAIRKAQQPFQDEILRSDMFKEIQSTKLQLVGVS